MSKKTKILLIVLAALLLLVLIAFFALKGFYSRGVHFLGRAAHVQTVQTCYVFGADDPPAGTAVLAVDETLSGFPHDGFYSLFQGYMSVSEYPVPLEDATRVLTQNGTQGFAVTSDSDYPDIAYSAIAQVAPDAQVEYSPNTYNLILNQEEPNRLIVIIRTQDGSYAAVTGDSPEEARQTLIDYHNSR